MTTVDFETTIIGAGGMGSAAAYHLARDGQSVLLLEQFEIGHVRGSSHGESRIIRLSYDHPTYVQLAQAAYRWWAETEADLGQQLLFRTGGLDLSAPRNPIFEACHAALQTLNIAHEVLDAVEIRRRFPQFQIDNRTIGMYQLDAGILSPTRCVTLLTQRARHYGAHVLDRTAARSVQLHDDRAEVKTDTGIFRCRNLIISAGAWTGPMLKALGRSLPLTVTQEQYAFYQPDHPEQFQPDRFPIFIHYGYPQTEQRIDYYGFPIFGHTGVKVGEHHVGPAVTADTRSFDVDPVRLQRLNSYVRALLPDVHAKAGQAATCLYTNTPDQHFVIDSLPGYPHVFVASPCSGHGFKFAILIGRILADLAERGETKYPIGLFTLSRFQ
jgi:sarcosine oxidase